MAALNFPNSPSLNDTHTENGVTFKWNGAAWDRLGDIGAQGATGSTGAQGLTGPVAGSSTQVVYKDGSNNPAGSSSFTFDGTNLTVGGNVSIGGTLTYEDVTNIDSVGLITARAGVKIPDGQNLTLGTDGDVGIKHQSGHFEINNSTGNTYFQTNGQIRLRGEHSGSTEEMIIATAGSSVDLYYDNSKKFETTSSGVEVSSGNLTMQSNGRIFVGNGGNATNPMFANVSDTNTGIAFPAADTMMFTTGGSERLRIDSSGRARINTAGSPSADLHVGGTSGVLNVYFQTSSSTGAYHKYSLGDNGADLGYFGSARQISSSGQSAGFCMRSQGHIEFCTGGSAERLRITSAGQMGLGTNDPNSYGSNVKLAVANTSGTCGLSIISATNGDGNLYYADGTSGDATYRGFIRYNHTTDQFRIGVAGAEKLRITSAGLVGVDVTSPTANLDVNGSLQLRASGNTTYATRIYSRLDSTHCSVIESYLNNSTAFEMMGTYADSGGANPRIAIGAGGQNVGINLTDPAYDLDVAGSIRAKGTGPGAGLLLHTNTGVTASANLMQIWSSQSNGFSFHTNGTGDGSNEVMRLTGAGQLNIGGNYTQTNYRLQVDGGITGDYFVGRNLSHRTGFKWGASGIYYYTLGGSRSGNGASFTMFEVSGMQNSKFVEFQLSFGHSGGGSHGSYRRVAYQSNGYQGLITLEDTGNINYGGGGGFTINKPSNTTIRVVWNGCSGFADGYVFVCEMKSSSSGAAFQNVNSAFS